MATRVLAGIVAGAGMPSDRVLKAMADAIDMAATDGEDEEGGELRRSWSSGRMATGDAVRVLVLTAARARGGE
jgi:hypothetical protein